MLVYIISLYFLTLDNLFARSVAGEFHQIGKSRSEFIRPDDQSRSTEVSDQGSDSLKEHVPVVKGKKNNKNISKFLFENKGKAITAAVGITVLIIAISLMKKKKKLRLRRKLAEASHALKAELFEWERLYDKALDFKTFISKREQENQEFIDEFKHVFYSANLESDPVIIALEDSKLEEEKQRLWKRKIEPYYLKADFGSFLRLRTLFSDLAEKLVHMGFRNAELEQYNIYSYKPLVFDSNALRTFIDTKKEAGALDEASVEMCEFFLKHCVKAMELCSNYGTARRNYYRIFQDRHVKLLSLGVTYE